MRKIIVEYTRKQKSLIDDAKQQADKIFNGVDAKDILYEPEKFRQFILEKAYMRFSQNILGPAANLGYSLTVDLKKATNKTGDERGRK